MDTAITLSVDVHAPIGKIWELWTSPEHIAHWNNIDENWHTPLVEINFKEGGSFLYRMETRDGITGFDHKGVFDRIIPYQRIEYSLVDGRRSVIRFDNNDNSVMVSETFDPEKETPLQEQKEFCRLILESFRSYAESLASKSNRMI